MPGRRDEILAARAPASPTGYAATTIEQIAARSGASNGSIYHHFGAKDGILAALYVEALASYQEELLALLRDADAEAGIRGAVAHHLEWVERNPDGTRLLFEHRQTLERSPRAAAVAERNRAALPEVRASAGTRRRGGRAA